MPVQLRNGKILMKNGKVAMTCECCNGEDDGGDGDYECGPCLEVVFFTGKPQTNIFRDGPKTLSEGTWCIEWASGSWRNDNDDPGVLRYESFFLGILDEFGDHIGNVTGELLRIGYNTSGPQIITVTEETERVYIWFNTGDEHVEDPEVELTWRLCRINPFL
jgi:hypothetical protein